MDEELCNYSECGHVPNHALNPRLEQMMSVLPVPDKAVKIMCTFHKRNYIFGTGFSPKYFVKTNKN